MGLVVKNVNKSFGDKHVVDNISFELKKPGVFGLLGTNGACKTRCFNCSKSRSDTWLC